MSKKNGGYILAYVMFVLVLLCLIAVAVCSSALKNLTIQNDAVDRMEQRLAAESDVERFVATVVTEAIATDSGQKSSHDTALEYAKTCFLTAVTKAGTEANIAVSVGNVVWSNVIWSDSSSNDLYKYGYNCTVTLQAVVQGVQVDAVVIFPVEITIDDDSYEIETDEVDENGNKTGNKKKEIVPVFIGELTAVASKYDAFSVQYKTNEGGGT